MGRLSFIFFINANIQTRAAARAAPTGWVILLLVGAGLAPARVSIHPHPAIIRSFNREFLVNASLFFTAIDSAFFVPIKIHKSLALVNAV
jgi:hypothetical protein